MVRGKRSEKKNGATPPEPPVEADRQPDVEAEGEAGDNQFELTEDQKYALYCQWKRQYETAKLAWDDAKSEADSKKGEFRALCKKVQAELGSDAVERIKDLIKLDTPEGEAEIKASIDRMVWAANWAGAVDGAQLEIFTDLRPIDDKARANGKRDGLAGKPFQPMYATGTSALRAYEEGFNLGQETLAKGFKPLEVSTIGDTASTETVVE